MKKMKRTIGDYPRKDLPASTLVGLTRKNIVPDHLAVQHLDNLLFMNCPLKGNFCLDGHDTILLIFPSLILCKLVMK